MQQVVSLRVAHPFEDPLDRILAEIAIRIQLPPSKYRLACERYATVAGYVERDGSPLKGLVERFYPQGSMAIGATIAARGKDEEYDIDIIAELLLAVGTDPAVALDSLYSAIRGAPGSRYYDMVKRRTRCVTIYYEDGMHMDITPAILRDEHLPRTSDIFHNDPDKPNEPAETLLMNAWGFSQIFTANTADTTAFAKAFSQSTRAVDVRADADVEPVDPQEDPAEKSSDVVSLQLIKRVRNTRYANRTNRMPPSVLLSKYVSDAAKPVMSLSESLIMHTENMLEQLKRAENSGRLVHEVNPSCRDDCFTDRWPQRRSDQQLYIADLQDLLTALYELTQADLSMRDMQDRLVVLFGEYPTKAAVRATQEHVGAATRSAQTGHKVGGGIVVSAASSANAARANTNMGDSPG